MVGEGIRRKGVRGQFLIADVKMRAELSNRALVGFAFRPFHAGRSALLHKQPARHMALSTCIVQQVCTAETPPAVSEMLRRMCGRASQACLGKWKVDSNGSHLQIPVPAAWTVIHGGALRSR